MRRQSTAGRLNRLRLAHFRRSFRSRRTRKLAAILPADDIGYSRLAGANEDRSLAHLRALCSELIDPTYPAHLLLRPERDYHRKIARHQIIPTGHMTTPSVKRAPPFFCVITICPLSAMLVWTLVTTIGLPGDKSAELTPNSPAGSWIE
jgi:hypothetical protein